jgi:hypothetical protein
MLRSTRLYVLALVPAMLLASEPARGQTTATSGPTISPASGQLYPNRFVNNVGFGPSTRSTNLNPLGINYSDCVQDMILRFDVVVSGFDGSESLQVWATKSGDCLTTGERGIGSAAATCWLVDQGFSGLVIGTSTMKTFDIRVQDIVGLENSPLPAGANYIRQGASACTAQTSFVGVPMDLFFLPLGTDQNVKGTPYKYHIPSADLVGPPAPAGVSIADGDTLFVVNWMPNVDSDTTGYDIFIDPIPGQEDASASSVAVPMLYCPDTGAPLPEAGGDGSIDDSGDAGASGAAMTNDASSTDAACFYITVGGAPAVSSTCNDPALAGGIVQDSGTTTDDAGNVISGSGGISTIQPQYLVPGAAGLTVSGKAAGNYTIGGLRNGTVYNVAVSAVDTSGNVGPPSPQSCDYPAPVNDFWNLYRQGGGQAGGSLCALEAIGAPVPSVAGIALFAATSTLMLRRRRKRR